MKLSRRRSPVKRLAVFGPLSITLLSASPAVAYCFTTTCKEAGVQGARCSPESSRQTLPPVPPDCGVPIAWHRGCIGFGIQQDVALDLTPTQVRWLLQDAFTAWENADCGTGGPGIRIDDLGEVDCATVEYNQRGGNVNALVFRDTDWPHEGNQNALALTTVSFDVNTAEIYDADIEVNTFSRVLTTTQTTTDWDLLSVLTHEAGHALGLAHSTELDGNGDTATMIATINAGSTALRSLSNDDMAGVCAAYPPTDEPIETCNPIPRHGFSSECLAEQTHGDCSLAGAPLRPRGNQGRWAPVLLAGLLAGLWLTRRRRRGRAWLLPWRRELPRDAR